MPPRKPSSNLPVDIQNLRGWFNAMRSAKQNGRSGGVSVVTIKAICDERGDPVVYLVESKKLSPISKSDTLMDLLREMGA